MPATVFQPMHSLTMLALLVGFVLAFATGRALRKMH